MSINIKELINKNFKEALNQQKQVDHLPRPENVMALFKELFPDWLTHDEYNTLKTDTEARGEAFNDHGIKYLYKWQQEALEDIFGPLLEYPDVKDMQIRVALAGAYGVGKSVLLSIIILLHLHYCYLYEPDREHNGAVFSGSEDQLKQVVWRNIVNMSYKRGFNHTADSIFINEKFNVFAKTWNKGNLDSIQGLHGANVLVIFDEGTAICNQVYDKVDTFSTNARFIWVVTANPTSTAGRFYELFSHPAYTEMWLAKHISVYDSYPGGHNYARGIVARYGEESDEARVCIFGLFPQTETGAIFPKYVIDACMSRGPTALDKRICFGVDLASGRGRDYSVIVVRDPIQVWEIRKEKKMEIPDFVELLFRYIDYYKPMFVAIDRVGLGEGWATFIARAVLHKNMRIIPINGGSRSENLNYVDKRTELLMIMRSWLMDIGRLPDRPTLREEMLGLTYFNTATGKIQARTKKELEKSPDEVDAISYSFVSHMI